MAEGDTRSDRHTSWNESLWADFLRCHCRSFIAAQRVLHRCTACQGRLSRRLVFFRHNRVKRLMHKVHTLTDN